MTKLADNDVLKNLKIKLEAESDEKMKKLIENGKDYSNHPDQIYHDNIENSYARLSEEFKVK